MRNFRVFFWLSSRPLWLCAAIALLTLALLSAMRWGGVLQAVELSAYDWMLHWRPAEPSDSRIVLIGETEADIHRYGHPLSDQVLALALQKLLFAGVRVIGVDKYRDVPVPPGTGELANLLKSHGNIVWIRYLGSGGQDAIAPPAALLNSEQVGFNDVVVDPDGVTRRGLLYLSDGNDTYPSFPLLATLHYLARQGIRPESGEAGHLKLAAATLHPLTSQTGGYAGIDAGGYQIMLDYPGLHGSFFTTFSLAQLLDGEIPAAALHDKLVLLGGMAPSLGDYRQLPTGMQRYGVEQHAYVAGQLLSIALDERPPLRFLPKAAELFGLLLCCLAGSAGGYRRNGNLLYPAASLAVPALIGIAGVTALRGGWWIPCVLLLLGWLAALALSFIGFAALEHNERRQLMRLFERHVSPEVAATLWAAREDFFSGGGVKPDQLVATVLFTDLAGFTAVAETMEPLPLMQWLNRYMDEMSRVIVEQGGMIDKYIGDAIMAVFGVPVKRATDADIAQDAVQAVQCALLMGERLQVLNEDWCRQGLPAIGMRVGIHTGPLVAGSLGGPTRLEYTVIGDTVNIASRLESFDKHLAAPRREQPWRILIGQATFHYVCAGFLTESVGTCQLKGRQNSMQVYRVVSRL
ncbi:MAG: adenylate/guanylate cyclase domain-containing protein [Methylococcaceae bacterium]|nr:MAG: adenylate/guanylate cyclase domain-containing protein [Methylococcaceae bacterium]